MQRWLLQSQGYPLRLIVTELRETRLKLLLCLKQRFLVGLRRTGNVFFSRRALRLCVPTVKFAFGLPVNFGWLHCLELSLQEWLWGFHCLISVSRRWLLLLLTQAVQDLIVVN